MATRALAAIVDEKRHLVAYLLEHMRLDQRLVLEWKYADGLSVREIASRMGQSEKSTESLLYRARAEFRRAYELQTHDTLASESTPRERNLKRPTPVRARTFLND